MRIMIPASGGLDSTLLLWETLTETTHDVVAVHYPEDNSVHYPDELLPDDFPARSLTAFEATCAWMKERGRDFGSYVVDVVRHDAAGHPYDRWARMPVRPGFEETAPLYWFRCRYASHGHHARRLEADECHLGLHTWNRRRGENWITEERDVFRDHAGWGILLRSPWVARCDGIYSGRSRLTNLRRVPRALFALTIRCKTSAAAPCGECYLCRVQRFYDRFCIDLSDADLQSVEARIEELGGFGPHLAKANPSTHRHWTIPSLLSDEDSWQVWFEERARP